MATQMPPTPPTNTRHRSSAEEHPSVFDLTLDHEVRECWLTSIRALRDHHYTYAVEFAGSRSGWRGKIFVPETKLNRDARQAWTNHYWSHPVGPGPEGMPIERSEATKGVAKFLDLESEELTRDGRQEMYVRKIEVTFQKGKYEGVCYLLKTDPIVMKAIEDARERLGAVESVEKDESEEEMSEWQRRHVHTVAFVNGAPRIGKKSDVEVWDMGGEDVCFEGKASVRSLQDREGLREVVIGIGMQGKKYFLKGWLGDRMKHGRFMVMKEDEV